MWLIVTDYLSLSYRLTIFFLSLIINHIDNCENGCRIDCGPKFFLIFLSFPSSYIPNTPLVQIILKEKCNQF